MSSYRLLDTEREELELLIYELENSKLPVRVHAARLLLLTKLFKAVRDLERLPPRVRAILDRIPRISDRHAWDRLSAAEREEAGLDNLEEELRGNERRSQPAGGR